MKLPLSNISSGYNAIVALNDNFTKLMNELQEKVLYRDNPSGEPNQMENDLDMNGHSLYNVKGISLEDGTILATQAYVDAGDEATLASAGLYTDEAIENLNLELVGGDITTARYSYVAIGGETTVTTPWGTFAESELFLNGVHQNKFEGAYSIVGNTFVFTTPLEAGDNVFILLGQALELADYASLHVQTFTATAGQDQYVLVAPALLTPSFMVFVNGVKQHTSTYSLNGDTLTLSEGLVEGDELEVVAFDKVQEETTYTSPILLQRNTIQASTLVPDGFNGLSINPTIMPGVVVTVAPTSTWAIVGD